MPRLYIVIIVPFFVEKSKWGCNNNPMLTLTNIVDNREMLSGQTEESLRTALSGVGLDGFEVIRCGAHAPALTPGLVQGVHLVFWADWVDFWRGDTKALLQKFGSRAAWEEYYGCAGPEGLLAQYKAELAYAEMMDAKYVVFHVSDVSPEETLTYRRFHTDEAVIDASAELLNLLFRGKTYPFELLLENLWWPGLTLTSPAMTERLLSAVQYEKTGLLLDTGHLFNANPALADEAACLAFAHAMLDAHGALASAIRGMHLHGAATGRIVREMLATQPALAADFPGRFAQAYDWVMRIDPHCALTCPGVEKLVARVAPEYLVLELAGGELAARLPMLRAQCAALREDRLR